MALTWLDQLLFMTAVGLLALYGLAFSSHFPAEFRSPELKRGVGVAVLWGTSVAASLAVFVTFAIALRTLSWPGIIIGGGAMLLAAPLLLRPFHNSFVNGPMSLLAFATGGVVVAFCLWTVS